MRRRPMPDSAHPPGMSLTADIAEAVAAADGESTKLRARAVSAFRIRKAYRRVFLQPGKATAADQSMVLRDIMDRSALGCASITLEPLELAALEGARRVGLHVFERLKLDESRLRQLEFDLRNLKDEDE